MRASCWSAGSRPGHTARSSHGSEGHARHSASAVALDFGCNPGGTVHTVAFRGGPSPFHLPPAPGTGSGLRPRPRGDVLSRSGHAELYATTVPKPKDSA